MEKIVKRKSLYSGKRLSIPWPEFYVLYNGQEEFPDEVIFKLSDLFEKPEELNIPKRAAPLLELEARVININKGRNEEIARRCKKLAEYSAFIAKTYEFFEEYGDKEKAVNEAVKFCSKHDILSEFLEIHGSEVLNMLLEEWNMEDAKEVWQEEAREEGLAKGLEKGREEANQEKLQTAANLKKLGVSVEIIAQATGLSVKEIDAI